MGREKDHDRKGQGSGTWWDKYAATVFFGSIKGNTQDSVMKIILIDESDYVLGTVLGSW